LEGAELEAAGSLIEVGDVENDPPIFYTLSFIGALSL
jgi:hypothetical protein